MTKESCRCLYCRFRAYLVVPSFIFLKFCAFELLTKPQLCQHKTHLLDAYALIFRGYYAFKTQEFKGMDTQPLWGL
jgi:hypothetical protein